eukprot:INCI2534.1.p1 GENE.INCI2534.1~~INCI2534.1.p1  ORF type:complete len:718 (-),score=93.35 INCI2534.1:8-1960(-)
MLISTTKRETVLSDSGRLPGTDVGRHLGPGKYSVDSQSIGARKQRASFGGFGTAARNLVPVKEGPGPGRFQQNQFNFKKKKKKQKPSSVFKSKKDRFDAGIAGSAAHLGPGHYALPSDFDKRPQSKNNASAPPLIVGHEPSVPSVPRINQSFGYEEGADGKLKLHQPAKVIYGGAKYGNHNDVNDRTSWISKQILDTVGPAYYDRPNDTSFAAAMAKRSKPGKTAGGHVPFAKTKDRRRLFEPSKIKGNELPDPDNPGPGHYDYHIKVSAKRGIEKQNKPTAAFASEVPQLHDAIQNYRATLPGPSNYRPLDEQQRNRVLHTGVAAFGSHSDRSSVFDPQPDTASAPGPGSYSAATPGAFERGPQQQYSDFESAFGSTAERPCLAPTKTATAGTVGPGAYGDSRTFSGLTQKINHMATVGARGVFSTTAARFQPDQNLDGSRIQDGPGVGRYKLKDPRFQRDRESSSFQSTSTRRSRPAVGRNPEYVMVGRDSTPAPGSYNIDTLSIGGQAARVSKLHKGDAKSGAAFSASEKRLRADQIFGQKMNPTPGPGDYTTDRGTLAKKVRPRRAATTSGIPSRDGFGGSTVRFQKDAPSLGSLGAGYDPNSMVKKSFNRKAGYKPAKGLDRRVVRSHVDHPAGGNTISVRGKHS